MPVVYCDGKGVTRVVNDEAVIVFDKDANISHKGWSELPCVKNHISHFNTVTEGNGSCTKK